jgi:hypothetical protein
MRIKESLFLTLFLADAVLANGAGEQFSFLDQFALGEHTFADVQRRLGPASVTESGDAGAYRASICFIVSGELLIHFVAGPLGGAEHHLGGFDIEKAEPQSSFAECARSQVTVDTAIGGLSLGMNRDDFRRVVDPLGQSPSDSTRFVFQHKQMINRLEYDVVIHVEASFEDGRMVRLGVRKTETY